MKNNEEKALPARKLQRPGNGGRNPLLDKGWLTNHNLN
jgi:hypothetical protein